MSFSKPALRNTFYTGDLDIIGKTETLTTDLYVPATPLNVLDSMGHQLIKVCIHTFFPYSFR